MSIVRVPLVADSVARLMRRYVHPAPASELRFPDIPARTTITSIPTRHGEVATTIYGPPAEVQEMPGVYVNVHGGGFIIGHREQDDPWCRYLAAHANVVVINADYLLAPTWRFPTQLDQVYDVVAWASSPDRNWDGDRLCVGGQSAGGNLSAAVARLALENDGPRIRLQLLHYPGSLDMVTKMKNKSSPLGRKAVVHPWMGNVFDVAYAPDAKQRRDRLVSPAWGANADGIEGIAPALVIAAEYDRLRNEAAFYAEKLDAAGSLVEYFEVSGVDHGYNIMPGASTPAQAAQTTTQMYEFMADHVARATTG
jgi:acetyl esterase